MSETNVQKFKRLLSELFMLDHADLDFGIYRIMNAKRDDIQRFLDEDLLQHVQGELGRLDSGKRIGLLSQRNELLQKAHDLGVADPEHMPKIKEIDAELAQIPDLSAIENEVFSNLYDFFRRYYSEGDFLSLRRYKEGVYALPYEGEEIKLHWANADQYYIKSNEYFRDYTFQLADRRRVHFKLVSADTEQNNNKAANNEKRVFILREKDFIAEVDGELVVYFEYRLDPEKRKQSTLNQQAVGIVLTNPICRENWAAALAMLPSQDSSSQRSRLEKHLADYTSRNTRDYFIHKDLRAFLRRELDFYIKNEVMHLDNIESEAAPRVEAYLSKIKALRRVAHKVIEFLTQLEEFQKKLWLKRKFVIETNYCVTLDRVPEELYSHILTNEAQHDEWVRLFAIDEIHGDSVSVGYSKPITIDFLKANPFLVLDTRFFSTEFKFALVSSFNDIDAEIDGLLIRSDNFQALNLIGKKHSKQVRCIYIDPPYNTGDDGFVYKDSYQISSWMAMIHDRVELSRELMLDNGVLLTSIDDNQADWLKALLQTSFGKESFVGNFVWRRRVSSSLAQSWISTDHEYVFVCSAKPSAVEIRGAERDMAKYNIPDGTGRFYASMPLTVGMNRYQRPNQWYELKNPRTGTGYWPPSNRVWGYFPPTMQEKIAADRIIWPEDFPARKLTTPRLKSYPDEAKRDRKPISTWLAEKNGASNVDYNEDDTVVLQTGKNEEGTRILKSILGEIPQIYPKPVSLISVLVEQFAFEGDYVVDFFAGSGTTGHAVINLNRNDGLNRKYILVEMGNYFDSILKPRLMRIVHSSTWADSRPVDRDGCSQLIKYLRLESYEDTLNNLQIAQTPMQSQLLWNQAQTGFREDYFLRYMLETESTGSMSLLNHQRFVNPFDYRLDISAGTVGESQSTVIDLVETFNYLLGLHVRRIRSYGAIYTVEGRISNVQRVLIIWRNQEEIDNDALDTFFRDQGYAEADFDLIYINGDNNLENLKQETERWSVFLIEEAFHQLMFDIRGR